MAFPSAVPFCSNSDAGDLFFSKQAKPCFGTSVASVSCYIGKIIFRRENSKDGGIWNLPASGTALPTCGLEKGWAFCPKCGKIPEISHCDKPKCPICFEFWQKRQSARIASRLREVASLWGQRGKTMLVSHYVLSLPVSCHELSKTAIGYQQLRKDALRLLKRSGVNGGVLVFHSHRFALEKPLWVFSPHWHILGYGFCDSRIAHREGWILKKIGQRSKPRGVASYLLSHAGIASENSIKSISWFGLASCRWVSVVVHYEISEMRCVCGCHLMNEQGELLFRREKKELYKLRIKPPSQKIFSANGTLEKKLHFSVGVGIVL